jgi:alkylation response protein AidB-like acyl-CoA dehydrogenase
MDFGDNEEQAAFRHEVRSFLQAELPDRFRNTRIETEELVTMFDTLAEWRGKLAKKGWIAPAWPKEYGGAGLSVMEQFIMNEEFAQMRAPGVGGMGVAMLGPTLIVHGNEEQKKEHLGRILSGEVMWCQGFSEPEAGSDLASLRTRAVKDGDDYVINGQKIWTSYAKYAHWMFLLARTDFEAPKHKGISYFLVDMKTPGVEVRPLPDMAGGAIFNEVFFDNVRVPNRNLVGEENRGWYIAATTLDFERSNIGSAVSARLAIEEMIRFAKGDGSRVSVLARNPSLRHELADRRIEAEVARMLSFRIASMQARGLIPNYEASMAKTFASELSQRIANTGVKLLGLYGSLQGKQAPEEGRLSRAYLGSVGITIAAGTSEIQRNIIATRGLGLPRQ